MKDWASHIANNINSRLFPPHTPLYDPAWSMAPISVEEHTDDIAAALRKAKFDALNDFADTIEKAKPMWLKKEWEVASEIMGMARATALVWATTDTKGREPRP